MKKILSIFVTILLLLNNITVLAANDDKISIYENFDDGKVDTEVWSDAVLSEMPDAGEGKCIKLSGNKDCDVILPKTLTDGVVIVEYDMFTPTVADGIQSFIFYANNASTNLIAVVTDGTAIRNSNWSNIVSTNFAGQWHNYKIIVDITDGKYYFQFDGANIGGLVNGAYSSQFKSAGVSSFFFRSGTTMYVDNVRVTTVEALNTFEANPSDGAENVSVDSSIKLCFNAPVNTALLNNTNISLINKRTGDSVPVDVKNIKDASVTVAPKVPLEYFTDYEVVLSNNVKTTSGQTFLNNSTSFKTVQMEIKDDIEIQESSFLDNRSEISLKNLSDTNIDVSVITALYKNNGDLPDTMVDYNVEQKTIDAGDTQNFVSKAFTTEENKEYTVKIMVWDSLENKNILAPPVIFGAEKEATLTENSTSSEVEFIKKDVDINVGVVEIDAISGMGGDLRASYTVEDPDGKFVYIGESKTQGDNGAFGIDFKFKQGTKDGTYTVKARVTRALEITSDTFAVDTSGAIPAAANVKISGDLIIGRKVVGDYDFFHIGDAKESGSTYKWYVSESKTDGFKEIENETQKELLLTEDYSGKFIKFEVTPKTSEAPGETVITEEAYEVLTPPFARNVRIDGNVSLGETVSAVYKYYHVSSAAEGDTKFCWLYSSNGTDWEEVGTYSSLYIGNSYKGGYIKLGVTPVSEVYPYTGVTVYSDVESVSGRVVPRGSSSGYKGSSIVTVPSETEEPEKPKDTENKTTNSAFSDISGHWSEKEVVELAKSGVINGYSDGTFKPQLNISRAEFVTLIVNALGIEEGESKKEFSDVKAEDWFYNAVNNASSNDVISGDGENFRPYDNITREEIAVVITNAYKLKYSDEIECEDAHFNDFDMISEWAKESVNICSSLEIVTGDNNKDFRAKEFATRAEAAVIINRFMNINQSMIDELKKDNKLDLLYTLGLLQEKDTENATVGDLAEVMANLKVYYDANGREEEPLIWDEALKQCLLALNYSAIIEQSGDNYDTLVQFATDEEMLDGVNCLMGGTVSISDFSKLIYNTIHCLPVSDSYVGGSITLNKEEQTLLNQKLDIVIREGIVTGIPISKLYSSDGVRDGYIEVSNVPYEYNGDDVEDLLGIPVCIYVDPEYDEIVFMEKLIDEYEILKINWKDIEDFSGLTLTYSDSSRVKREKLDAETVVLVNNVYKGFADSVSKDLLKPERGEILLIDNDDDGDFDIVNVTDYEVVVVDSANVGNSMILFKNGKGHIKLEDDTSKNKIRYTITRNGEDYPLSEIAEWDVLIVKSAKNKSGDAFYDIQVVRRTVKGVVTGYDDEHIFIDRVKYVLAPSLNLNGIEAGVSYTFAFAGNDEIAAVCTESTVNYGYLVRASYSEDDEIGYIMLCTAGNEKTTLELADKVNYNGTARKTPEEVCSEFKTHQLIAYNLNDEGKINEIHKAVDNSTTMDNINEFSLDAAKGFRRYYQEQFNGFYQMANDGVAFFVANVKEGEKFTLEHVKVGNTSAYKTSNGVDCEFYDVDELGNAKAAIFYDFVNGAIPEKTVPVIVVADIVTEVGDDGVAGNKMYFYEEGVLKSLFIADKVEKSNAIETPYDHHDKINSILELQTGDVIEYATDVEGKLAVYRPVFLRGENNTLGSYAQTEAGIQPLYDSVYNKVDYAKDGNFVLNYGTDKRRYTFINTTMILKYSSETDELTVASKDDILGANNVGIDAASKVVAVRNWTQLKLVVIYD